MKKLLLLFTTLLFISCSGDDNEITFLEKYDGAMFQKEFLATNNACLVPWDCVNEYNYQYFSFHSDDEFLVHAISMYPFRDITGATDGKRYVTCIYYNQNNEDIEVLVNTENEFKYSERVLNLDGTDSERYFRFLIVGDSLSINWGDAKIINNYGGSNWQRSLAVISDVCTN